MNQLSSKYRGFTLIELLVVIAIIAILAAILFPVFAQAREKARAINCESNEKQIALGILMYTQDNDSMYPFSEAWNWPASSTATGTGSNGENEEWTTMVTPYIKDTQFGGWASSGGVFVCPDAPNIFAVGNPGGTFPNGEYVVRSDVFVPHDAGCIPQTLGATCLNPPSENESKISDTSDIIMMWEPGGNLGSGGATPPGSASSWAFTGNNTYGVPITAGVYPTQTAAGWVTSAGLYTSLDSAHLNGDCDQPKNNFAWGDYAGCLAYPRYRHSSNTTTNIAFFDGHIKAIIKGRLNYTNNVFLPGVCNTVGTTPQHCAPTSPVAPF